MGLMVNLLLLKNDDSCTVLLEVYTKKYCFSPEAEMLTGCMDGKFLSNFDFSLGWKQASCCEAVLDFILD